MLQHLEDRRLLAVTSTVDPSGVLRVVADAAEAIALRCIAGNVQVNGADPGSGPASCASVTAIEVLGIAGTAANVIDLASVVPAQFPALARIEVDGGGGSDRLIGPDVAKSWFVTAVDEGSLGGDALESAFTTFTFTSVEDLIGGPAADAFLFTDGASLSGVLSGGGGVDTLDFGDLTGPVVVSLAGSGASGFQGAATGVGVAFLGIDVLAGGRSGADTLVGRGVDSTWRLANTQTYSDGASTLTVSAFETLQGGAGGDTFDLFSDAAGGLAAQLRGGAGDDRFLFSTFATLTGGLSGEAGDDTLSYADFSSAIAVVLLGSGDEGYRGVERGTIRGGAFDGINALIGGGLGPDLLTGEDEASTWSLGPAATYDDGLGHGVLTVSAFETLQGGTAGDTFLIAVDTAADLRGGAGDDGFRFAADGVTLAGTIAGEGGRDAIDSSGTRAAVRVDLAAGTATGVRGGIGGIEDATGGAGDDTLIGDSRDNILTGGDGDDLLVDGDGNDSLFGGAGPDTYVLTLGGAGTDLIGDPGGDDTLDLSNARSGVTIDLDRPAVQAVSPGIQVQLAGQIEGFIGSAFPDTIAAVRLAVPRRIDGRSPTTAPGDTLDFDARGRLATLTPTTILVDGSVAVSYTSLETINIRNTGTVVPAAPTAPDLQAASDSGLSQTDNITSVTRPAFDIGEIRGGMTVFLLRDGVTVAALFVPPGPDGTVTIVDPDPVADGLHHYEARQGDGASSLGAVSPALLVTIDTVAPVPLSIPNLAVAPGSDTGILGDNRTSVRRPVLIGTGEPNAIEEVIDAAGNVLGRVPAGAGKAFLVPLAGDLPLGPIVLRVRARDAAGNLGPPGAPLVLTIVAADGDAEGRTDPAVFAPTTATPQAGPWSIAGTGPGLQAQLFGSRTGRPVQGDGGGINDLAGFRPSPAVRFLRRSRAGGLARQFGPAGEPADPPRSAIVRPRRRAPHAAPRRGVSVLSPAVPHGPTPRARRAGSAESGSIGSGPPARPDAGVLRRTS